MLKIDPKYLKQTSPTLATAAQQRKGTKYAFGFGQSPFPCPDILVQTFREHAQNTAYPEVQGLKQTREAIAASYAHTPDEVFIFPGSKAALFALLSVLPGEVYLPQGSWVTYAPQACMQEKPVHWLPTRFENSFKLDPDTLDEAFTKAKTEKILILNSPCNPTGAVYTASELQAIARVCRQHGALVLFDFIYASGKDFNDAPTHHLGEFYPEGTIITGGLSKVLSSGGWRFGFAVLPDGKQWQPVKKALRFYMSETISGVCVPVQHAAAVSFSRHPEVAAYIADTQAILRHVGLRVWRKLADAGLAVTKPAGGFYLCVDFGSRGRVDQELQEAGISLLAGKHFGFPPEQGIYRLAYVDFDGALALQHLRSAGDLRFPLSHLDEGCDVICKL